jgi:hypothetical protein
MQFIFEVTYTDEGKELKDIIQRELEDVIGEDNQVPFGDTYVNEGWYAQDCEHNNAIFEQAMQEIKKDYESDEFTNISVISCNY